MPQFGHIPEKIVRQHGTNGFDPKQLNGYLSEIDINDAEIERLTDDCKAECAPYKEAIKDILTAVKDAGINEAKTAGEVAQHGLRRKQVRKDEIDRRVNALDMMDRADYESMVAALGTLADTPLGEAALKVARALNEAGATMTVELAGGEQGGTA